MLRGAILLVPLLTCLASAASAQAEVPADALAPLSSLDSSAAAALPSAPRKPEGYVLGIYRLVRPGQPEDPALADVERVLRGIAESAPNVKSVSFMAQPPKACEPDDDACFALLGAFQQLDLIVLGSLTKADNGLALQVRLIDVAASRRISQAQQLVVSADPLEIQSWAEALACQLLIPGGCRGAALVDLDLPEMQLVVDNRPLDRAPRTAHPVAPERLELPVGPHRVRVQIGQRTSLERTLPIRRDGAPGIALYGRQTEQGGLVLLAPDDLPLGRDGSRAAPVSASVRTGPHRWSRPTGLAAAGLGVVAFGLGLYELQHGRSLAKDANAAYDANGGYYRSTDLDVLRSARTANTVGKVATVAGVGLAAAGAFLYFAF